MTAAFPQSRLTGAVSLMLAQALVLFLGYITHPIIGRILGPGAYGIFNVVLSMQTIFGLILTLGIPVAISRFVARDDAHARSILRQGLKLQFLAAIGLSLTLAVVSPLLSRLLNDTDLTPYIAFSAFVIASQAFYPVYVQFLSGMHRFNQQAILTGLYAVGKLVGALALIFIIHVYGALAGFAVGGIIAGLVGWYWTRSLGGSQPKTIPVRSFLGFAGVYVITLVGLQVLISLDLFMVKALLHSDTETGYYSAAVTLSRISYMLLQALGFVLLPSVSKLTAPGASHDEAATFIGDTFRYLIALIVPSVALAAATSRPLINLFFSAAYSTAAPALTILMVGVGSIAFYLLLSNIVAGAGRPKVSLYITLSTLAVSAALGSILIPRYGLVGAAWQTTIAGGLGLVLITAYTVRTFHIPLPIKSTLNILIAAAVAIAPTYLWQATPLTLVPQYLLSGLIYISILLILREITPADRQRVAHLHPALHRLAP